MIKKYLGQE